MRGGKLDRNFVLGKLFLDFWVLVFVYKDISNSLLIVKEGEVGDLKF